MLRCLLLLTVVFAFGCASSQPTPTATASLEDLIVDASELPTGCTVRAVNDDAPPFITANPMASGDPAFIQGIIEIGFRGDGSAEDVEEALVGVYDSSHEIGIIAFRFTSTEVARQARAAAESNADGQEVLLDGTTLAVLWRDGPADACFHTLADHARQTLEVE